MPTYSGYLTNTGLVPLIQEVSVLHRRLAADGRNHQAILVQREFQLFLVELQRVAKVIAEDAQKAIKDYEVSTQVRGHGGQGPSLTDFIGKSDPIFDVPGTVGVNDEDYLKQNGVGWWWTNEEGYWGHIGREIRGTFSPSFTPPISGGGGDTAFFPRWYGARVGVGVIQEPIPDRHFTEMGFNEAKALWHAQLGQAQDDFVAKVRAIVHAATPVARP